MNSELLGYCQRTATLEQSLTEIADRCSAAPKEDLSGAVQSLDQALQLQSKDGAAITQRMDDLEQSLREMQNAQAKRDPPGESPREIMENAVLPLT